MKEVGSEDLSENGFVCKSLSTSGQEWGTTLCASNNSIDSMKSELKLSVGFPRIPISLHQKTSKTYLTNPSLADDIIHMGEK